MPRGPERRRGGEGPSRRRAHRSARARRERPSARGHVVFMRRAAPPNQGFTVGLGEVVLAAPHSERTNAGIVVVIGVAVAVVLVERVVHLVVVAVRTTY